MRVQTFAAALLVASTVPLMGQSSVAGAPETFVVNAQAKGGGDTAAAAHFEIRVTSYTSDREQKVVTDALKSGGYAAFLTALRKAPEVGYVEIDGKKTTIRFARQTPVDKNRTVVLVTDKPLFFVGGASVDAKPRAGYEVALFELKMDASGIGAGTMAAAARVKPGGETGVVVDDYADAPIRLTSIMRKVG